MRIDVTDVRRHVETWRAASLLRLGSGCPLSTFTNILCLWHKGGGIFRKRLGHILLPK
jgi:hypothetical protein